LRYETFITGCPTTTPIALGVLVVIPAIYLGLMCLTLISRIDGLRSNGPRQRSYASELENVKASIPVELRGLWPR
jgi:hypothetical protein